MGIRISQAVVVQYFNQLSFIQCADRLSRLVMVYQDYPQARWILTHPLAADPQVETLLSTIRNSLCSSRSNRLITSRIRMFDWNRGTWYRRLLCR